MKYYIKIESGKIIGHPMTVENYKQCFPDHDISTIPNGYAEFRRVEKPIVGLYEYCPQESVYDWDGNVVYDRWDVRPLTDKEKQSVISLAHSKWAENGVEKYPSWVFVEDTCDFKPPVPIPSNELPPNQFYEWDEESVSWIVKTNEFEFAPEWPRTAPF